MAPYIKSENRPDIDKLVEPLVAHISALPLEEQDGALNYAMTKVIKHVYPLRYFHINRALGVLSAVAFEFYRIVAAPYEDVKRKENGEVA